MVTERDRDRKILYFHIRKETTMMEREPNDERVIQDKDNEL